MKKQIANIDSTNINKVEFDTAIDELKVEFHSGSIYVYFNVKEAVFNAMDNAQSKGKFFQQEIKNKYDYRQVK